MSNKTELQENNADLATVLSIVEGLPNAITVKSGDFVYNGNERTNYKVLNNKVLIGADTAFVKINTTGTHVGRLWTNYANTEDAVISFWIINGVLDSVICGNAVSFSITKDTDWFFDKDTGTIDISSSENIDASFYMPSGGAPTTWEYHIYNGGKVE